MLREPVKLGQRPAESLCSNDGMRLSNPIERMNANVDKPLNGIPIPSQLLLLDHPFSDDFIDRRLDKPSRDSLTGAGSLAVIGHGVCVHFQIA
jgi:hypothetical protein